MVNLTIILTMAFLVLLLLLHEPLREG